MVHMEVKCKGEAQQRVNVEIIEEALVLQKKAPSLIKI